MTAVVPFPARGPAAAVEVTPEMVWAGLEEWSGFDEARDDLERFLARLYRAMEAARRGPPPAA